MLCTLQYYRSSGAEVRAPGALHTGLTVWASNGWVHNVSRIDLHSGIIGAVLIVIVSTSSLRVAGADAVAERFVIASGESVVTYRVNETLFNEGNRIKTAVGTTTAVQGEILVDRAKPANTKIGSIRIDISQFKSDSDRRDNAIRHQWLESAKYPTAEFTTTEITGLPGKYVDGHDIPITIRGNLKIRDTVRPTTWKALARVDGRKLIVTGSTTIRMTDFGFDPPAIIFLRTENEVQLEFRFVAYH